MTCKKLAPVVAVVFAVVSCSASPGHGRPEKALFTYDARFATSYRPGQTILIRWVASATSKTSSKRSLPVTLSASISGPFGDVVQAKAPSNAAGNTLAAAPIKTSAYAGSAPTSRITIPVDADAGYYDLTTKISEDGGTVTGVSTVHIRTG